MNVYYLDSSAWVKRHVEEPGTRWVNRLLSKGAAVVCSSIGVVEVLSALARTPRIPQRQLEKTAASIRREFAAFEIVDLTRSVLERAMDLPMLYRLRGADAVHLASAMAYRAALGDGDDLIVVSSDQDLLTAAAGARFTVVDPAKEAAG